MNEEIIIIKKFNVLFYGKWQLLHGLNIVVRAINLCKKYSNIHFTLIGSHNQNNFRKEAEEFLEKNECKNYTWLENMSIPKLVEHINKADLVLAGGFHDDSKARIVIRNSTYEVAQCKALMLIPDTPANNELLTDGESCYMCKIGDPKDLAKKIMVVSQ